MFPDLSSLSRRDALKIIGAGTVGTIAALTPNWWGGRLDEARDVLPTSKLEDGLDWDLAFQNLAMDVRSPFIQPANDPGILKWQLENDRVLEFPAPLTKVSGRSEGDIFLATGAHSRNLGALFRKPDAEAYIVHTTVNLSHHHMKDSFKKVTRLDDVSAKFYYVVRPFINADKTMVIENNPTDADGNPIESRSERTRVPYTGFDQKYTSLAKIDPATASIKWDDPEDQVAWDAMGTATQFPSFSGFGAENVSTVFTSIASALAGFALPQGATVKDRVTHAMLINPPFFQTEYGILLLKQIGINVTTVVNEMQLLHDFTTRMQASGQPKAAE